MRAALTAFVRVEPNTVLPWVEGNVSPSDPRSAAEVATELAAQRQHGLAQWSIGEPELQRYARAVAPRVITPGSSAGETLHVLSSLERRAGRWDHDVESARASLSAAVSLLLRLLGRDPDPAKSKEHVLLSILAERRLTRGDNADLRAGRDAEPDGPRLPRLEQRGALVRGQTADRRGSRVEGLASAGAQDGYSSAQLTSVLKQLEPRWFLVRDAHDNAGTRLVMPRWAMSFLKGPMTRGEIRKALGERGWEPNILGAKHACGIV